MPYTEKQRRYFHFKSEQGGKDAGTFKKLAEEADSLPVRPPVKAPHKTRHPGSSKKRHKE